MLPSDVRTMSPVTRQSDAIQHHFDASQHLIQRQQQQ